LDFRESELRDSVDCPDESWKLLEELSERTWKLPDPEEACDEFVHDCTPFMRK
jgi:hypothetical protein